MRRPVGLEQSELSGRGDGEVGGMQQVVQGLEGYIVSQHGDRLLVCRKDHEQKITDYIK